jgi:hypothetical protein
MYKTVLRKNFTQLNSPYEKLPVIGALNRYFNVLKVHFINYVPM